MSINRVFDFTLSAPFPKDRTCCRIFGRAIRFSGSGNQENHNQARRWGYWNIDEGEVRLRVMPKGIWYSMSLMLTPLYLLWSVVDRIRLFTSIQGKRVIGDYRFQTCGL